MGNHRSYSSVYNVQRIILLFFYSLAMIALCIPIAKWFNHLFPDNFFPLVLILILYTVFAVVLGTFIYVVSYIPFNLAGAFDPIKNDIAAGIITGKEAFGKRVTHFITEFFDFSFLDIEYAVFMAEGTGLICYSDREELIRALNDFNLPSLCAPGDKIRHLGRIKIHNKSCHFYLLPIRFGERWLGCIAFFTSRRIRKFFLEIIQEFENNFLDDQLMYIINLSSGNQSKSEKLP